jgi:succinate dehydrogenase flavin-adding protein (antitoxin of CptAB toxin-antitoxin module)
MTSTLATAEQAVTQLTPEELAQFRRWFAEYDSDLWDAQIEADATAGKLDALAQEALAEYHAGKATEI